MTDQVEYAGLARRTAAALIDAFIVGVGLLLATLWQDTLALYPALSGTVWLAVTALLLTGCWVYWLGTPGKLLLGCQVLDAVTGRPIGPRQGIVRALGYAASVLPLGLGFWAIAWDRRGQGFHDRLAGTVVVVEAGEVGHDESQKSLKQLVRELR